MSHLEACKRAAAGYRETIAHQINRGDVDPEIITRKRRDLQGYDRVIYMAARNAYEARTMNEQRYRLYRRIAKAGARLDRALAEKVKAEAEYARLLAEYFPAERTKTGKSPHGFTPPNPKNGVGNGLVPLVRDMHLNSLRST